MLDKNRHKTVLVKILKEIYDDADLRNVLGFKGGTAAFLFYDLPRLSVDLDFDLLLVEKKEVVFNKLKKILPHFGKLLDATKKRYTIFFLLSYEKDNRKIKIEISKRPTISSFISKNYLGIPMLIMKKEDMFAGKLSALLTRQKFAARDLFDLWFYLSKEWEINEAVFKDKTGLILKEGIKQTIVKIKAIKKNHLLQGLGELLDEKQKGWVRDKLKEELLFLLKLYLDNLK
jgi:predicted nucleotidyltransferase component of viral defense system